LPIGGGAIPPPGRGLSPVATRLERYRSTSDNQPVI